MFDLPKLIVLLAIMRLLQVPSDVGAAIGIFIVAGNVVVLNPGRVVDHPVLRGGGVAQVLEPGRRSRKRLTGQTGPSP